MPLQSFINSEAYFADQDAFTRYVEDVINPVRKEAGLEIVPRGAARHLYAALHSGAHLVTPVPAAQPVSPTREASAAEAPQSSVAVEAGTPQATAPSTDPI